MRPHDHALMNQKDGIVGGDWTKSRSSDSGMGQWTRQKTDMPGKLQQELVEMFWITNADVHSQLRGTTAGKPNHSLRLLLFGPQGCTQSFSKTLTAHGSFSCCSGLLNCIGACSAGGVCLQVTKCKFLWHPAVSCALWELSHDPTAERAPQLDHVVETLRQTLELFQFNYNQASPFAQEHCDIIWSATKSNLGVTSLCQLLGIMLFRTVSWSMNSTELFCFLFGRDSSRDKHKHGLKKYLKKKKKQLGFYF